MSLAAEKPIQPPADLIFKRKVRFLGAIKELWGARALIHTIAERDLRARYKQALLGFAWALIIPLFMMVVFSVFVQRVVNADTGGVPYPLFSYVALLPWQFFSMTVNNGGQSLVSNASLLNKVYCPREVFPFASSISAGFDGLISTGMLVVLFGVFTFMPKVTALWVPVLFVVQLAFTLGITLVISSVLMYMRDLRQVLPIILQFGLFATPVAYRVEAEGFAAQAYAALNPMAPVIDGYRRTILYGQAPDWGLLGIAAIAAFAVLGMGYLLFKRLETGFADVA